MAKIKIALKDILKKEGGYSDREEDMGGKTRYGITWLTARRNRYFGRMKNMPIKVAMDIYIKEFWNKLRLSEVEDQDVANKVFDIAVNCGVRTSAKITQRILNALNRYGKDWDDIKVDGKIGPITIKNLNKATLKRKLNILKGLNILQGSLYIKLAENPKRRDKMNINGWVANRINL